MNKNYQKELDQIINSIQLEGSTPSLLLHSCCAPCSSYVLEYLSRYFKITVYYYNPNLDSEKEYKKRAEEQKNFIRRFPAVNPIDFIEDAFEQEIFYKMAEGLEHVPEGGERCFRCYRLRLRKTAALAEQLGMDYFCTTLSVSPLKNAERLNEIGLSLAKEYKVDYLVSDFKKKNGYQRSVELSKEYKMYRQDYCGCIYSKRERRNTV